MVLKPNDENNVNAETRPQGGITIENASAWILRAGVVISVAIMFVGIIVSFVRGHAPIERFEKSHFDPPAVIWQQLRDGRGKAIIEAGIYVLVLTPVMRVFMSMVLFLFKERDWLYALITFLVLSLTVTGFLLLR